MSCLTSSMFFVMPACASRFSEAHVIYAPVRTVHERVYITPASAIPGIWNTDSGEVECSCVDVWRYAGRVQVLRAAPHRPADHHHRAGDQPGRGEASTPSSERSDVARSVPSHGCRNGSSKILLVMSWSRARTRLPVEPVGAVCGGQGVVGNAPSALRQSTPRVSRGIAGVFHSTGRVHRRLEPGGSVAGVADVNVLGAMSLSVACSCRLLSRINLKQRRDETETETTNKNGRRKDGRRKDGGRNKQSRAQ